MSKVYRQTDNGKQIIRKAYLSFQLWGAEKYVSIKLLFTINEAYIFLSYVKYRKIVVIKVQRKYQ